MKRSASKITVASIFSIMALLFLTGCFCWPSLPALIHSGSCSAPQYAANGAKGAAAVALPPKTFIAYSHKGDIWMMDNDGKNKKQLTKNPAREFSLSASFQAERIWFIRETGHFYETLDYGDVYTCDFEGKNLKQITSGIKIRFAEVSTDGRNLAVSVTDGETSDMWLLDAEKEKQDEAGSHINLTGDLTASGIGGREGSTFSAWSEQVDKLVFTFKPDSSASLGISTSDVYVVNADGSGRTLLMKGANQPSLNILGTTAVAATGAHWGTMGIAQVGLSGGSAKDVLPVSTGDPLYSTYSPIFITTYEDINEWPTVIYGKTTHPAAPGLPVNTLEKYRIEGGVSKVLVTKEGPDNLITNIGTDGTYSPIYFQTGKAGSLDTNNATIWSVKSDGKDLKMLSAAEGDDDSEPTIAVSYTWNYKNKKGRSTSGAKCHWPYADN